MVVLTIVTKKNGETFFFDEPFPKVHFMKLVSCSLYNSWKNLSTWGTVRATHEKRDFNLLSVPSGHHTLETLVVYLNQDKNKAESAAYTENGGIYFVSKHFKSDFLRVSRIGRHSRKIDFSFISPKHTFRSTYSKKNSLKFQRFILRPKFKKVRNLHIMAVFAA